MNQHSLNHQYYQHKSSSKSNLTRTPLQSKINKNLTQEYPKDKLIEKTAQLFKQKSIPIVSKPINGPSTKSLLDNDNDSIDNYNKDKDCSSSNCCFMYSPKRKLNIDLFTPPLSASPVNIESELHLALSPLKIERMNIITSGDMKQIAEYEAFFNEKIDYSF